MTATVTRRERTKAARPREKTLAIKIKPVQPDRSKIELGDDAAARHWVKTLGVSRDAITAAIEKVGPNPETVRKEIARDAINDKESIAAAEPK